MRRTLLAALVAAAGLFAAKQIDDAGKFLKAMPRDEHVEHALNRLTFGARPGDAERVGAIGLKKWIELQLHPERILQNPALAPKL